MLPFKFSSTGCAFNEREEWVKSLLLTQKSSDVRLEKLEKVIKHVQKPSDDSGHKFQKKLYEEQHEFSLKVLHHFDCCFIREQHWQGRYRSRYVSQTPLVGFCTVLRKEPLAEDSKDE